LGTEKPVYTLPGVSYYPALGAVKLIELVSKFKAEKINLMTAQILREAYGYKYFCSQKARSELGWAPRQAFEETVKKAFEYYKEHRLLI